MGQKIHRGLQVRSWTEAKRNKMAERQAGGMSLGLKLQREKEGEM